jgi:hypothetical protein
VCRSNPFDQGRGGLLAAYADVPVVLRLDGEVMVASGFTAHVQGQGGSFIYSARARPDGFWIAVRTSDATEVDRELWHVKLDGGASFLGAYPPTPDGIGDTPRYDAIADDGALYSTGLDDGNAYVLVRRTLDGESVVLVRVTNESEYLSIRPFRVFTGP